MPKQNPQSRASKGEAHSGARRGRKSLGGLRIILRLTPQEVEMLEQKHQQTGHSRTDLIRRAIDAFYFTKRRESDWEPRP